MSDLFFGEIDKQSKTETAKYMASRGKHSGTIDNKIESDTKDLKEYNSVQSEEE